jgi:hypothetical protein
MADQIRPKHLHSAWKTNGIQGAAASNDGNEDCWELIAAPAAPHLFLQVRNSCFIFSCEFSTCSMVQVTSIWQVPHLHFSCIFFPFLFGDLPLCCHNPSEISWMRLSHELNKHPQWDSTFLFLYAGVVQYVQISALCNSKEIHV